MRGATIFGALVALAGPAGPAEAAPAPTTVFASVGHSEWCPAGTVRLDLRSGRYTVTAPRTWRTCRTPHWPDRIRTGVLAHDRLALVRAAYDLAIADGLVHPDCRNGGRPTRIVIDNGGRTILRLTSRGRTLSPPRGLACWNEPAFRLHRLLEGLFNPRR